MDRLKEKERRFARRSFSFPMDIKGCALAKRRFHLHRRYSMKVEIIEDFKFPPKNYSWRSHQVSASRGLGGRTD